MVEDGGGKIGHKKAQKTQLEVFVFYVPFGAKLSIREIREIRSCFLNLELRNSGWWLVRKTGARGQRSDVSGQKATVREF